MLFASLHLKFSEKCMAKCLVFSKYNSKEMKKKKHFGFKRKQKYYLIIERIIHGIKCNLISSSGIYTEFNLIKCVHDDGAIPNKHFKCRVQAEMSKKIAITVKMNLKKKKKNDKFFHHQRLGIIKY